MIDLPSGPEIRNFVDSRREPPQALPYPPPRQAYQQEFIPQVQALAMQPPPQMQGQGENPFAMERYENVPLPDVPVTFGGGIADSLLNDNEVPEQIRKKFWFVFHKDNVLTFLDKERKENKLLNFDITKIDILNSIPFYDYTFERELEFGILRNVFETKLDRAMGFKGGNVKNERVMLQSQFHEQRQITEVGSQSQIKEGFFKRLLGRR